MSYQTLPLVKMHSGGNDYVYLDLVGGAALPEDVDLPRLAAEISDRHFGVGADGLILIYRTSSGRLGMRMWNSDGSEGEMCGNGMRCLAAYVYRRGYVSASRFEVETRAGVIVPEVRRPSQGTTPAVVAVEMGPPREVRPVRVGLPTPEAGEPPGLGVTPPGWAGAELEGTFVSLGNPHLVVPVQDAEAVPLEQVGPVLERHPLFPQRTNVEFVQVLRPDRLRLRVWERGSGVTLACGTGAGASLVAMVLAGRSERRATVVVDGGELEAEWAPGGPVVVSGEAVEVFEAVYLRPLPRKHRNHPSQ